jgi:hypothetical protein
LYTRAGLAITSGTNGGYVGYNVSSTGGVTTQQVNAGAVLPLTDGWKLNPTLTYQISPQQAMQLGLNVERRSWSFGPVYTQKPDGTWSIEWKVQYNAPKPLNEPANPLQPVPTRPQRPAQQPQSAVPASLLVSSSFPTSTGPNPGPAAPAAPPSTPPSFTEPFGPGIRVIDGHELQEPVGDRRVPIPKPNIPQFVVPGQGPGTLTAPPGFPTHIPLVPFPAPEPQRINPLQLSPQSLNSLTASAELIGGGA